MKERGDGRTGEPGFVQFIYGTEDLFDAWAEAANASVAIFLCVCVGGMGFFFGLMIRLG